MMFVRQSTHDAIVAAKDAEIAVLVKQLESAEQINDEVHRELWRQDDAVADLRARLAVFTAPRMRGDRGRFLPTNHSAADVNLGDLA